MKINTTVIAAMCLALVAVGCPSAGAQAKTDAGRLALDEAEAKLYAARSIIADVIIDQNGKFKTGFVQCMKPHFVHIELWDAPSADAVVPRDPSKPHEILFSDGKSSWRIDPDGKMVQQPVDPINAYWPLANFFEKQGFDTSLSYAFPESQMPASVKTDTWQGSPSRDAVWTAADGSEPLRFVLVDNIVRAVIFGKDYYTKIDNVRLDAPLPPADFVLHKPAFAHVWSKLDPQARAILLNAKNAYASVQAVTATVMQVTHTIANGKPSPDSLEEVTTVQLKRPYCWTTKCVSKAFLQSTESKTMNRSEVSDGQWVWTVSDGNGGGYQKMRAYEHDPDGAVVNTRTPDDTGGLLSPIFSPDNALYLEADWMDPSLQWVRYAGTISWRGKPYRILRSFYSYRTVGGTQTNVCAIYVGADNLIHRFVVDQSQPGGSINETDSYYTSLNLHPNISQAVFQFQPGGKKPTYVQMGPRGAGALPLLAIGTVAPDVAANDTHGRSVHLSDFKGKIVLIEFWESGCGPCLASMPYLNTLAHKYQDKSVAVLALDGLDQTDAFITWVAAHKSYDGVRYVVDPLPETLGMRYHISGYPTQYLIDRDGHIAWSNVGYGLGDDSMGKAIGKALTQ